MTFSDFDSIADDIQLATRRNGSIASTFTPEQFAGLPAKSLPCGYFILTLTDGSTRDFRIRLEKMGAMAGQRSLSLLTGPTRESDEWEKVATVTEQGFQIAPRYRKERVSVWAAALWELLHGRTFNTYTVQSDIRCRWSLRKLTDGAARERQVNLSAAKRFGLAPTRQRKPREEK